MSEDANAKAVSSLDDAFFLDLDSGGGGDDDQSDGDHGARGIGTTAIERRYRASTILMKTMRTSPLSWT